MTTWDPNNKNADMALSNGNLTVTKTGASGIWESVCATGSGKTSGKWYWRNKCTSSSGYVSACVTNTTIPTPTGYIGSDANGWISYTLLGSAGAAQHNSVTLTSSLPVYHTSGDYVVAAYDADRGSIYFTVQTAAGVLDTNWNGSNANPSSNTGGFSVTPGTAMLPGASILNVGDTATLDTTGTIAAATLAGFNQFDAVTAVASYTAGVAWRHSINVTPSDTIFLPAATDYLSFSNTGVQTIQVTTLGGETLSIPGLAAGVFHPIRARQVWSTGTTVTNIVAYWT